MSTSEGLQLLEILGIFSGAIFFVWKVGRWFGAIEVSIREGFARITQTQQRLEQTLNEHLVESDRHVDELTAHEIRLRVLESLK